MLAVIAIDSFKGSLTTIQAGQAAAEGIRRAYPEAEVSVYPLADGGEGTVDALTGAAGGTPHTVTVTGPLGTPTPARYGILADGTTAVMEMAAAAGLPLLSLDQRNPLYTTTFGVGEMIRDAIQKGCRSFIIGIGGSATNDGGTGMLQALGFELLNVEGRPIAAGGNGLHELAEIRTENALPALKECTFHVACDVTNPLCGPNGCSAVFGPQKGATAEMIRQMDADLARYAVLTQEVLPHAEPERAGAGAAGGLGFAMMAYLHARLEPGIELILRETGLLAEIPRADVVVTGEGRLDGQTAMGKAPAGVAAAAKRYGKPVVAFSGCTTEEAGACNDCGIDAFFPIIQQPCTLQEAMNPENAGKNLCRTAEQAFRLIRTFREPEPEFNV